MRSIPTMFLLLVGSVVSLHYDSQTIAATLTAPASSSAVGAIAPASSSAVVAVWKDDNKKIKAMIERATANKATKLVSQCYRFVKGKENLTTHQKLLFALALDNFLDDKSNELFGELVGERRTALDFVIRTQKQMRKDVKSATSDEIKAEIANQGDQEQFDCIFAQCSLSEAEEWKQKTEDVRKAGEAESKGKTPANIAVILEKIKNQARAIIGESGIFVKDFCPIEHEYIGAIVPTLNTNLPIESRYPACVIIPSDKNDGTCQFILVLSCNGKGPIKSQRTLKSIIEQRKINTLSHSLIEDGEKMFEINIADLENVVNDSDVVITISKIGSKTLSVNLGEFKALVATSRGDVPEKYDSLEEFLSYYVAHIKQLLILVYYTFNDPISLEYRLEVSGAFALYSINKLIKEIEEIEKAETLNTVQKWVEQKYKAINEFNGKMFECSLITGSEADLDKMRKALEEVQEKSIREGSNSDERYRALVAAAAELAAKLHCKLIDKQVFYADDATQEMRVLFENTPDGAYTKSAVRRGKDDLIIIMSKQSAAKKPPFKQIASIASKVISELLISEIDRIIAQFNKSNKLEMLTGVSQKPKN